MTDDKNRMFHVPGLRLWVCLLLSVILFAAMDNVQVLADTLSPGDKGTAVDRVKQRLYELKYYTTKRYGKLYDEGMEQRIASFQRVNGLEATGLTDEVTWDILFSEEARSAWRAPLMTEATIGFYVQPTLPEDYPRDLTPEGFRAEGESPYVFAGRDEGFWCYISEDIHIEIRRISEDKTPLIWYETDIQLGGEQKLCSLMDPADKKLVVKDPRQIAEEYGAILAFSDDFYGYRRQQGVKNAGIIIRDCTVLYERTLKSGKTGLPNLDIIALFDDGSLKTFRSSEYTAQEYLDMGVTDTWAFGPILLRDRTIDERILEGTENYHDEDPRCAIGMIAPGHYLVLTVLGRQKASLGVRPVWLAQRMKDLGCTEALNLDGGNSVALVFMGDMINKAEGADLSFMKGIRALTSMIGAGFTLME